MIGLYWAQGGIVFMLTVFLIYYYADRKVPIYAKLLLFCSFLCSFVCFAILPIDIYQSSEKNQQSLYVVQNSWVIIFYINFFTCWFFLPFAQEFQDSGEFTFSKKIKQSLIINGILIGILCIGAFIIVMYLVFAAKFTIQQLPSIFATLVNIFGLTLVSILLGFGLVSFPKQYFLRRDYKKLVNFCHRQAQIIKTDQQTILQEVYAIKCILQTDLNHSRLVQQKNSVLALINENFNFRNYALQDEQMLPSLKKKSSADLHKIVKKRILEKGVCQSKLDQLVDDLKGTTQSYLSNNYSRKKIYYTILFIFTAFLSVLIFFAQFSTFAHFLAPINLLQLMQLSGNVGLTINILLTIYVAYIVTHTIFRIKIYKVFSLHRGHSTASSLIFTSINLARVSYPLCFNYLQITGMPQSSFLQFFGQVNITEQISIVFPIVMLTFAFFNLFDIYDKILGYLGLSSYAFDSEQAEQKKQEGRNILIERFKERNIQNNQLQMIQLL